MLLPFSISEGGHCCLVICRKSFIKHNQLPSFSLSAGWPDTLTLCSPHGPQGACQASPWAQGQSRLSYNCGPHTVTHLCTWRTHPHYSNLVGCWSTADQNDKGRTEAVTGKNGCISINAQLLHKHHSLDTLDACELRAEPLLLTHCCSEAPACPVYLHGVWFWLLSINRMMK